LLELAWMLRQLAGGAASRRSSTPEALAGFIVSPLTDAIEQIAQRQSRGGLRVAPLVFGTIIQRASKPPVASPPEGQITHGREAPRASPPTLSKDQRASVSGNDAALADRISGRLQGRHRNLVKDVLLGSLQLGGAVGGRPHNFRWVRRRDVVVGPQIASRAVREFIQILDFMRGAAFADRPFTCLTRGVVRLRNRPFPRSVCGSRTAKCCSRRTLPRHAAAAQCGGSCRSPSMAR
jgi:hypothetical protein